ncbi:MAG: hypothetical protein K6D97_02590 [Clostridia bacterium]|nr:hypothetical protein [Clostridia bacterium]
MLEFKITQELKPNPKLLELIKNFTYKTKKGKVKVLLNTDRLTRNNYDGFWLLNYCEEHDHKIF